MDKRGARNTHDLSIIIYVVPGERNTLLSLKGLLAGAA